MTSSNYLPKTSTTSSPRQRCPDAYFVDNYDVIKDLNNYLARYSSIKARTFRDLTDDPRLEEGVAGLPEKLCLDPRYQDKGIHSEQQEIAREMRRQILDIFNEYQLSALVYPTATEEAVRIDNQQTHYNCKSRPPPACRQFRYPQDLAKQFPRQGLSFWRSRGQNKNC